MASGGGDFAPFFRRSSPDDILREEAMHALNEDLSAQTMPQFLWIHDEAPPSGGNFFYGGPSDESSILQEGNVEEAVDDSDAEDGIVIQPELSMTDLLPDEMWLAIAEYLDVEGWLAFILTNRRFYNIGQEPGVIGNAYLNTIRSHVADGHYDLASWRSWQGLYQTMARIGVFAAEKLEMLKALLAQRKTLPGALRALNEETIQNVAPLCPAQQRLLRRLWVQGTLLFGAENEPNGMFLREVTGVCHTFPQKAVVHITLQRLFSILEEFHHPVEAHVAALNALTMLFNEGILTDIDMQTTLTIMLRIVIRSDYPETTRKAATRGMQYILIGNALSDLRRGCVVETIMRVVQQNSAPATYRADLLSVLDITRIEGILSPRLRQQFIQFLPTLIHNVHFREVAHNYLIKLLDAELLSEKELTELGNALAPLIDDPSEDLRSRVVHLLAESIAQPGHPLEFREACFSAFKKCTQDPSITVAWALLAGIVRMYESRSDDTPLDLIYQTAVHLVGSEDQNISTTAIQLVERFHQEQGEHGLLSLYEPKSKL